MSISILHLVESLTAGGGCQAALALAKYSSCLGNFKHSFASTSYSEPEESFILQANQINATVHSPTNSAELDHLISQADIVQLHWWNCPSNSLFLRRNLPAMRLITWCHVGGHTAPQIIKSELIDYSDITVACSPYTYACPAISSLDIHKRIERTTMIYGSGDLNRLNNYKKIAHDTFNIGYIGTVGFVKMHHDFIKLCSQIDIPNVKFIVCGRGGAESKLRSDASLLGILDRFEFRGYISDILEVLNTIDLYGYPLCEDTYAASEINIQEVMYCGIPIVAFPYGGLSKLIINNFNGVLVNSHNEYKEAIEHLYRSPNERLRLGLNASEYAKQLFGAESSAKEFNVIYKNLINKPKHVRLWNSTQSNYPIENNNSGCSLFLESIGCAADIFLNTITSIQDGPLFNADKVVTKISYLMREGTLSSYQSNFQDDIYLNFWLGLALLDNDPYRAFTHFSKSLEKGFKHWRILWYLGICAIHLKNDVFLSQVTNQLNQIFKDCFYTNQLKHATSRTSIDNFPQTLSL